MNARGRCIKSWSPATTDANQSHAMGKLAQHLKSELGRDVLIPCHDINMKHCEVCFKNDPGKIFCPKSEQNKKPEFTEEFVKASVFDDLTDYTCSAPDRVLELLDKRGQKAFSYWTGYDDGSICDCGTPFVAEWSGSGLTQVSFRPLRNAEERPGFQEGATYVDEYTGAPRWLGNAGYYNNEEWEDLEEGEKKRRVAEGTAVFDSRPPTVFPQACSRKPEISSIFELSFKKNQVKEWDLVPNDSNSCILEDTYLAWHNGEPIDEESRQSEAGDHKWCEAKCDANPECGGWTLNKSNGWCALKRTNQIKKQKKKNFVSGIKNC